MRVGVDATSCANTRGYGRFTREVLRVLPAMSAGHELVYLLDEQSDRAFAVSAPNLTRTVVPNLEPPALAAAADGARSVADLLRMTAATRRAKLDVFFSPTVYTYFPLPPRLRAVVTIHDAIAERFPALTLPSRKARLFWRAKVALACRQARLILTVSEFAAREIAAVHRVHPGRIRVAPEASSAAYRPSESREQIEAIAGRVGLPSDASWFLYVGGLNPHKYVESIVAAHAAAVRAAHGPPPYLVLAGPGDADVFHESRRSVVASIDAHGTSQLVRWAGYLPDDALRHLHAGALALVLVSASEGFGLPAVEAAACGTPVIATTESPLPQLLAGGGIFVPPGDVAATTAAMSRLMSSPAERRSLGEQARVRAMALSWERCTRAVLDAIEEAAA